MKAHVMQRDQYLQVQNLSVYKVRRSSGQRAPDGSHGVMALQGHGDTVVVVLEWGHQAENGKRRCT